MGANISQKISNTEKDSYKTELSGTDSSLDSRMIHSTSSGSLDSREVETKFNQTYSIVRLLGRGASAEVYLVRDRDTRKEYACKIIRKSNSMNDDKTMKTESAIMTQLQHDNTLRMHELYETESTMWMILEQANGGDLMHGLAALPIYNEQSIAKIFKQILLGVKYLHQHGIIHRDLKLDNLLFSRTESGEMQVKIADFGLSALIQKPSQNQKKAKKNKQLKEMWGTVEYFAPEVYDRAYGSQADVWALGCILFEMLTGELAFPYREMPASVYEKVVGKVLNKKELRAFENKTSYIFLSAEARDLIKKMLKRNPLKRWDIDECLAHPWITGEGMTPESTPRYFEELPAAKQLIQTRAQRRVKRYESLVREVSIPVRSMADLQL